MTPTAIPFRHHGQIPFGSGRRRARHNTTATTAPTAKTICHFATPMASAREGEGLRKGRAVRRS
jgi:hypothetical protein